MSLNLNSLHQSTRLNGFLLATVLAAAGASAMAQGAPAASSGPSATGSHGSHSQHMSMGMGKHDPAKMQAIRVKHQADLKTKLKITPAQEGAWTSYTAAMQPPPVMGSRPTDAQRAEMNKLSTPERLDKMRSMRAERMAQMNSEMDNRSVATKALYAALAPEQQKVFDAEHQKHGARGEHTKHGGHGAH